MSELSLEIGKIILRIESRNEKFIVLIKKDYRNFLVKNYPQEDLNIFISEKKLSSGNKISVEKKGRDFILRGEKFRALFDRRKRFLNLYADCNQSVFNTFLRVFYSLILVFYEGVLVHSLGLARANKGYLFVGPSSSGKSTTAKRVRGFLVLSDELVILRRFKRRFYIFSTPFGGEYQGVRNRGVLLEKVFFLNGDKSVKNEDFWGTFLNFLSNTFFFPKDKECVKRVIRFIREVSLRFKGIRVNVLSNFEDVSRLISS